MWCQEDQARSKRTNDKNSANGLVCGAKETMQDAKEPAIRKVSENSCVVPKRPGMMQKNQLKEQCQWTHVV